MCGRFAVTVLGFPRYNISPTQSIPVIREGPEGAYEMVEMRWGLIP